MQCRTLGSQGLTVSAIGYGSMGLTMAYGPGDEQEGIAAIRRALAWLLAQGEHIVPIPGTRSPQRIEENAGAADVTLTESDLAAIHDILPNGGFGARYPEQAMPTWT